MIKSIVLEAGEFTKELQNILIQTDADPDLQLTSCKAICNLAIDFQKILAKEEPLIKKLVELSRSPNNELKTAACYSLKNLLFRCSKEVKTQVMKEITYPNLLLLLDDENIKV
jgi:hypothetical protein